MEMNSYSASTMPRFSLIIPAYNEQDYLPALLETVHTARTKYKKRESSIEIIVVDNDSSDRTAEVARSYGCLVVHEKKRIIATGDYDEQVLFAEDVQFLMNLKQLGRARKQKLVKLHSARAITSARKFDKHGDWHYFPILAREYLPCSFHLSASTDLQ